MICSRNGQNVAIIGMLTLHHYHPALPEMGWPTDMPARVSCLSRWLQDCIGSIGMHGLGGQGGSGGCRNGWLEDKWKVYVGWLQPIN